jgi:hypothetical protein
MRCVRRALFDDGATVAIDAAPFAGIRERFWAATADPFFALAAEAATGLSDQQSRARWLNILAQTARNLFDEAAPVDASGEGHPERVARAVRQLGAALSGYGADGEKVFRELGLDQPDAARKARIKTKGKAA